MGRIRFRAAPLQGLPPAWAALVAAIREVIEGSRFGSLDELGAAMYRRPASSERRDGKRISEWARGAQFPSSDDLALVITACDPTAVARVEALFHAAVAERTGQPAAPSDTTPAAAGEGVAVTVVSAPGGIAAQQIGSVTRTEEHHYHPHPPPTPTPRPQPRAVSRLVRVARPRSARGAAAAVIGIVAATALAYLVVALLGSATVATGMGVAVGLLVGAVVWLGLTRISRHELAQRRADRAAVLLSLAEAPAPSDEEKVARQQAARADPLGVLLAPQRALLGLQARRGERQRLLNWCDDPDGSAVWILAGPSGVGKTRLAVELARSLPNGWAAGRVVTGLAGQVWMPVLACPNPTLVVVDDADTEPGIPDLVQAASTQPAGGRRVRVLLLVRDHDTYTHWLRQELGDRDAAWPAVMLAAGGADGDRRRWFADTVHAAAAALGTPAPPVAGTDTRPVGAPGDPMILTLARGVLAAHHPHQAGALRGAGIDELAHAVLELEQQRWIRAAAQQRELLPVGLRPETLAEAMLALILTAPATQVEATATLRRLPSLAGESQKVLGNLVAWAHALYPAATDASVAPTAAPDFLHGALLAELTRPARAELLGHLDLDTGTDPSGERKAALLARLVRAVALFPAIEALIERVLAATQPAGLVKEIEVLILAGSAAWSLQPALVAAVDRRELSVEDAVRLLDLIGDAAWPRLGVALQEVLVRDARRRYQDDHANPQRASLAAALHRSGYWLFKVGEYRQALTATEEAVALRRPSTATDHGCHISDLAESLTNLGSILAVLGEHPRALTATEEVLALYRDLATVEPDRYSIDFARALNNLSNAMAEMGNHRRALDLIEEAVALRRGLTAIGPDTPGLARSLMDFGNRLGAVGERRRAVAATEEAVALYRNLAATKPARYTPDVAMCVHNLGHGYAAVEKNRRALTAIEEAVALYRNLAATEPALYTPDVAHTLNCLAIRLTEQGENRRAQAAIEESVTLYRTLAATNPTAHRPGLCIALLNLGNVLAAGQGDDRGRALAATEEAVALYRTLTAIQPDIHTSDLAIALNNLCVRLTAEGKHPRALAAIEEAVALHRALAAVEPATHIPRLTKSLTNLAICLERDKLWEDTLRIRAEGVSWFGRLDSLCPDDDTTTRYQRARDRLARWVTERGLDISAAYTAEAAASQDLPPLPGSTTG